MESERRAAARFAACIPARLYFTDGSEERAIVMDVSDAGMRISMKGAPRTGTVHAEVTLGDCPVVLSFRVAWQQRVSRSLRNVGLCLQRVDASTRRALRLWIAEQEYRIAHRRT